MYGWTDTVHISNNRLHLVHSMLPNNVEMLQLETNPELLLTKCKQALSTYHHQVCLYIYII